jgi:flagellar hook-associated protein 2
MSFGFLSTNNANANNPYRQLIDSLMQQESVKKVEIESRITEERTFTSAIDNVSSNLNALNTNLRDFEIGSGSNLNAFTAQSSNADAITATTSEFFSESGNLDVNILQLARADTFLSKRSENAASNSIAESVTDTLTNRRFTLSLPGIADEETGKPKSFTIELDELAGRTDRQILQEIATKLSDAAGPFLSASVIAEKEGTARLRIRSDETGADARIAFTNEKNPGETSMASFLGLTNESGENNDSIAEGLGAGRLFNVDKLNAKFELDGISFERTSNQVENVLPGLSFELKKVTENAETISITTDLDKSKEVIQGFINSMNRLTGDIRSKSTINAETGERGVLANNRSFRDLSFALRNRMLQSVDTGTDISTFLDIGLDFRQTGQLVIADEALLEEALKTNLNGVKELFANKDNGLAVSLKDEVDIYLRSETGIIPSIKRASESRVGTMENRLDSEEIFLRRRENILTQQFLQLEQLSIQIQSQFSAFSAFNSR